MNIEYSKKAAKTINGLDRPTKKRLWSAIHNLPDGDVKPLRGSIDRFRLRVGGWRIIFAYKENHTILIDKVAPRGEIYKGV